MSGRFRVAEVAFADHRELIQKIRHMVFVEEQGVPAELEMDEKDPLCSHVLAWHDGEAIATGRLLPDGHIGRVAVAVPWRGMGVGSGVMKELIKLARSSGFSKVALASQVTATGFYQRLGFKKIGNVYCEAGIDHVDMELQLN